MGFGTLPQVRLTVSPPEPKAGPSRPRPSPPDSQEEPDSEDSDDDSDGEDETIKELPSLPVTSQSSEQEEDSSQEEGEFHTPDRTLSSIPDRPDPDGNILGGLDLDETPTPGDTPTQIGPPQVTSTPDTSTQPLSATGPPPAANPLLFPDALEEPNLNPPDAWASLEEPPAVPSPSQAEPAPDTTDDAAGLLDHDRGSANLVPFENRTTRSGRLSEPPKRYSPYRK